MFEFLLASENVPFATAIALMLIIGAFEGVGVLLGMGLSDLLDSFIPDFELDKDVEVGELGSQNALSRLLGWLKVGKVPILMLLVVFLFAFGAVGYTLNFVATELFGLLLPTLVSVPVAVLVALPFTRAGGALLEAIMPRDESSAVSVDTLIGRIATITIGTASAAMAAEAKVQDMHGTVHYVRVRPETGHGPFTSQDALLLVRREGIEFVVIDANSVGSTAK